MGHKYRAVVEWFTVSFEDAVEELKNDGYTIKSLLEVEDD